MDFHLDVLLNLPNVSVETCSMHEGNVCLQINLLNRGIACPNCGQYTEEIHQVYSTLVRDLPVFGNTVYLKIPRRQFYCQTCQSYRTERLDFIDWKRRHTRRYEEKIYQRVQNSSIEQVSREEQVSYDEIQGIFNHKSAEVKKKDWGQPKRLSIDEFSMRKGHKNFVTTVANIDNSELLEVIDSHKQQEIIEVLMQQPFELRSQVTEVSVDMWGGFAKVRHGSLSKCCGCL